MVSFNTQIRKAFNTLAGILMEVNDNTSYTVSNGHLIHSYWLSHFSYPINLPRLDLIFFISLNVMLYVQNTTCILNQLLFLTTLFWEINWLAVTNFRNQA